MNKELKNELINFLKESVSVFNLYSEYEELYSWGKHLETRLLKGRGRPKGSKNKPKTTLEQSEQ